MTTPNFGQHARAACSHHYVMQKRSQGQRRRDPQLFCRFARTGGSNPLISWPVQRAPAARRFPPARHAAAATGAPGGQSEAAAAPADAVVHGALGLIARGHAAQLNNLSSATIRSIGNHEILEVRVADEYEASFRNQSMKTGAGIIAGFYSGGKSRRSYEGYGQNKCKPSHCCLSRIVILYRGATGSS